MTRVFASDYRDHDRDYPDPFPVQDLKRVDRPTTLIKNDEVARVDEREGGFHLDVQLVLISTYLTGLYARIKARR
jgi:hypothetical protein